MSVGTLRSSVSVKVPSRSKMMASGLLPPSGKGANAGGLSVVAACIIGTSLTASLGLSTQCCGLRPGGRLHVRPCSLAPLVSTDMHA